MIHVMLILCIGPDTFRAQEKARELEAAFRKKYDPTGSSVEHISSGKEGVDEVIERAGTISLFSSHRFLRGNNLLGDCPKVKQAVLIRVLVQDPERTIIVSVEDEPPAATTLKPFEKDVKVIKYEFPEQSGAAWMRWIQEMAERLKIEDKQILRRIAEATEGDSWYAWNELLKLAAGGTSHVVRTEEESIYYYADAYLKQNPAWSGIFKDQELTKQALNTFLSQARSALRVRDGATEGLHPYVVKKLGTLPSQNLEERFAHTLLAFFCQRSGYAADDEAAMVF